MIEFEAPKKLEIKSFNSTYAVLKWSLSIENVDEIYKKINNFQEKSYLSNKLSQSQLFKDISYELYIKEKTLNDLDTNKLDKIQKDELNESLKSMLNKPFRTFSYKHLVKSREKRTVSMMSSLEETEVSFEYNLTNLMSNTKYVFELSARISNLESQPSKPLTVLTSRMSHFVSYLVLMNVHSPKSFLDQCCK